MAKNKEIPQKPIVKSDTTNKTTPPKKSRKRVSIEEYALVNNIRPEVVAGFKVWLKGNIFHFDNEWDELFEQYKNRTL